MGLQLILDTSALRPAVVLAKDGTALEAWFGIEGQHHSQSLLAGIDGCLTKHNFTLKDLNSIAAGVGPGMFTGLRIGVATAKFLADALDLPVIPFCSLLAQALGASAAASERVFVLSDARSGRVYSLCLEAHERDPLREPTEAEVVACLPSVAAARMRSGDKLVGEAALIYAQEWPAGTVVLPEAESYFRPSALATLGHALFLAKRTQTALELQPRYLKTGQNHLP